MRKGTKYEGNLWTEEPHLNCLIPDDFIELDMSAVMQARENHKKITSDSGFVRRRLKFWKFVHGDVDVLYYYADWKYYVSESVADIISALASPHYRALYEAIRIRRNEASKA